MNVHYNAQGHVFIELEGAALELTRSEAEGLFVALGHTLQDMDVAQYDENGETQPQP